MRNENDPASGVVRRLVAALVLASVWMIAIPGIVRLGRDKSFMPTSGWLWAQLAFVVALAAALYALDIQRLRTAIHDDPSKADAIRAREWQRMIAPGWISRYVGYGVVMGLAVGIPIGAMLAFGLKPEELPYNSRVVMELIFISITVGWTLPLSFAIRWFGNRAHQSRAVLR
jgi:hypothetical protein